MLVAVCCLLSVVNCLVFVDCWSSLCVVRCLVSMCVAGLIVV